MLPGGVPLRGKPPATGCDPFGIVVREQRVGYGATIPMSRAAELNRSRDRPPHFTPDREDALNKILKVSFTHNTNLTASTFFV